MKIKDYMIKHLKFVESADVNDMIILINLSLIIDNIQDDNLKTEIQDFIENKIEDIKEKEL